MSQTLQPRATKRQDVVPAQRGAREPLVPLVERTKLPHRRMLKQCTASLVLLALVLGWWSFLRPSVLGGPVTFIVVTGQSMEPGLRTGDLAVLYERENYAKGDVVAFRATPEGGDPGEGAFVIHRIKDGDGEKGFVMRGDNNDWDDLWTPTTDEVAGEMLFSVPNAGVAMRWMSQPVHLAAMLAALMTAMVIGAEPRRKTSGNSVDSLVSSKSESSDEVQS
jgi:signal peptidase I